ncbi:MAG: cytochrome b/b6 domain-containing protein [Pseudomonadota bacterium]
MTTIRIWDLPTRLFHWGLAISITGSVISVNMNEMDLHGQFGFAVCTLLIFRVLWGIVGSETSRFLQFAPWPGRVAAYLRGTWSGVGHNPLGALSVFALLGVACAMVGTGIFANDDVFFEGPWAGWIGSSGSARATGLHEIFEKMLYVLVALHLIAIFFYRAVRQKDLIKPMITGRGPGTEVEQPRMAHPLLALPVLGLAVFLAGLVFRYWIT